MKDKGLRADYRPGRQGEGNCLSGTQWVCRGTIPALLTESSFVQLCSALRNYRVGCLWFHQYTATPRVICGFCLWLSQSTELLECCEYTRVPSFVTIRNHVASLRILRRKILKWTNLEKKKKGILHLSFQFRDIWPRKSMALTYQLHPTSSSSSDSHCSQFRAARTAAACRAQQLSSTEQASSYAFFSACTNSEADQRCPAGTESP